MTLSTSRPLTRPAGLGGGCLESGVIRVMIPRHNRSRDDGRAGRVGGRGLPEPEDGVPRMVRQRMSRLVAESHLPLEQTEENVQKGFCVISTHAPDAEGRDFVGG
jgi:hypothetical protein